MIVQMDSCRFLRCWQKIVSDGADVLLPSDIADMGISSCESSVSYLLVKLVDDDDDVYKLCLCVCVLQLDISIASGHWGSTVKNQNWTKFLTTVGELTAALQECPQDTFLATSV